MVSEVADHRLQPRAGIHRVAVETPNPRAVRVEAIDNLTAEVAGCAGHKYRRGPWTIRRGTNVRHAWKLRVEVDMKARRER
jgi:hypothetical protein